MMGFTGNARIGEILRGPLGHAYLISGPGPDENRGLANIMARSRVCFGSGERPCNACAACDKALRGIHPDILIVGKDDKKEIPVAAIRQIVHDAPTLPNEAEHKVYIVEEADNLNQSAQNAFLKILEEPPRFVTFLLLAENPLRLLPTVRSRCVHLSLVPDAAEIAAESEVHDLADAFYAAYLSGGMDFLHFCVELEKADRQILGELIEICYARFIERLGEPAADHLRVKKAVDLFDSLRDDLRFNVSAGHISGKILATLL